MMRTLTIIISFFMFQTTLANELEPVVDSHTHYNWNQAENTSPQQVLEKLAAQNVRLAAFSSSPPELALKVKELAPEKIFLFFSPYLTPMHRRNWHTDPDTLSRLEKALKTGQYQGIGEVHFMPGVPPAYNHPSVEKLLTLAEQYHASVLLHTDASNYRYFAKFCQGYPKVDFIWAHAGGILPAQQVGELLALCTNVIVELTARDPWRYVDSPITDEQGRLVSQWREIILRYPDRFMVGSDVVWPVIQMNSWFAEDTGWQRFDEFMNFHRRWVEDLPPPVSSQLLYENGWNFYQRFMTSDEE